MYYGVVVVSAGTKRQEVVGCLFDVVAVDFNFNVPQISVQGHRHARVSCSWEGVQKGLYETRKCPIPTPRRIPERLAYYIR
jgi:hypothetical protein